ncbi:cobalamin-independent methionine synthase II family protein [Candidatus Woesearchaeota archaeon]|nr:cobalamin-independent methionine synthase II family protein [Candidatus Woesearchaeota archaeon]
MTKIKTSVIGSYPRCPKLVGADFNPRWLLVSESKEDWIKNKTKELQDEAVRWAIKEQEETGIDIVSDGEQRRTNYILYHCHHLGGFDFENKEELVCRGGKVKTTVPVIRGPVKATKLFLADEFRFLRSLTNKEIKITIPGPLTIIDSVKDSYYFDEKKLAFDLAKAIQKEVKSLVKAGCLIIQIDEPVSIREPQKFFDFGLKALETCFEGAEEISKEIHICRGYPNNERDTKAEIEAYGQVIEALAHSVVNKIAVEDAHEHLDLGVFKKFGSKGIILGVVDIGNSRVETVEEIENRIKEVLKVVSPEKLLVAPDCGLLLLRPEVAKAKLTNLVLAAKNVGGLAGGP